MIQSPLIIRTFNGYVVLFGKFIARPVKWCQTVIPSYGIFKLHWTTTMDYFSCISFLGHLFLSLIMRKPVLCHMRTTKVQISLRIHAVWSAPLVYAAYCNDPKFSDRYVWANSVQTQIRLLLEEQSDLGLHCWQFRLHLLGALLFGKAILFKF